jgi:hypothetical protein
MSILKEHEVFPSKEFLENTLGEVYSIFEELETCFAQDEFAFGYDWSYSEAAKTWACRVYRDAANIFWITIHTGFFNTMFLFSEKQLENVAGLDVSDQVKTGLFKAKPIVELGLLPMRVKVSKKEQLTDLLKIVKFKIKTS